MSPVTHALLTPRLVLRHFERGDLDDLYRDGRRRSRDALPRLRLDRTHARAVRGGARAHGRSARPNARDTVCCTRAGATTAASSAAAGCSRCPKARTSRSPIGCRTTAGDQGFATEMARAVLAHGFDGLGLARIVGLTWPENVPSQRVLEKIGMRGEAEARALRPHDARVRRRRAREASGASARAIRAGAGRRAGVARACRRNAIARGSSRIATMSLPHEQADAFFALAKRRRDGEPVAYLTGVREFWGLRAARLRRGADSAAGDRDAGRARARMARRATRGARVLDLGTGSGAIALAFAHERPPARA